MPAADDFIGIEDPDKIDHTAETAGSWVGLKDAKCEGAWKCRGVNMGGKYVVETDAQGDSTLTVEGTVSWRGRKRNIDKGFGMFFAMATADDKSEWSAESWDPNENKWRMYSSTNRCPVRGMERCARNWRTYTFDKTWRRKAPVKENKVERTVSFSTRRPFYHKKQNRVLKLGESRKWRAGFMFGQWEGWAFSKMMVMCLSDGGVCGQPAEEPAVAAPVPAQKTREWSGLNSETCPRGSQCYGYGLSGLYTVKTDADGRSKLRVDGKLTWPNGSRNRDLGFGVFVAMSTVDDTTEWHAESWDPNTASWLFFSSHNSCSIRKMRSCSRKIRTFNFDKTWRKLMLKEKAQSVAFSHERDFAHKKATRQLKLGQTRQMRAGFVIGEWETKGYSRTMEVLISDGVNKAVGEVEPWTPDRSEEEVEQEWDENGEPVISEDEWDLPDDHVDADYGE